jgi:hypothetical protein
MGIALIRSLTERADELLSEMEKEFDKCLRELDVTPRAQNLTHEVIEKCANALDQLMYLAWETRVAPTLSAPQKPRGYFPAARDEQGLRSSLGAWGLVDIDVKDPSFAAAVRRWQPLTSQRNEWVATLRRLAAAKHVSLTPQKIQTEPRTVVSDQQGNSVSWGRGVTFGRGVSVLGAPINPATQLPEARPGVDARVEIWVRFVMEGTDINALGFCKEAVSKTKAIVDDFASTLGLPD